LQIEKVPHRSSERKKINTRKIQRGKGTALAKEIKKKWVVKNLKKGGWSTDSKRGKRAFKRSGEGENSNSLLKGGLR